MINLDDQNDPRIKPVDTVKDVHTEHCCTRHGCKYGDVHCTVAGGLKKNRKQQSFMCEVCDDELRDGGLELAYLLNKMYDEGHSAGWVAGEHNYVCGCKTPGKFGCEG